MRHFSASLMVPLFGGWLALTAVAAVFLCTLPMTQILGFEFAFIIGIPLSLGAGHLAAALPARWRKSASYASKTNTQSEHRPFHILLIAALSPPLALLLLALMIILANRLFVPPCNNAQGILFFLMIPTLSSIIATVTGLLIGTLISRKTVAIAVWYLVWTLSIALSVIEVWRTPAVFSFGPFIGYWPGVWYDKYISITPAFLTYRLFTITVTVWLVMTMRCFFDSREVRLRFFRPSLKPAIWLTAGLCAIIAFHLSGEQLGHRTSASRLKATLVHHVHSDHLDIYFDAHIPDAERRALAADARFSLNRLQLFFNIRSHPPITVYVFRDAAQKHASMGARHTSVAKPWLKETYIVSDSSPHWTLRHELAHLVAASFGRGPFQIAVDRTGLIPIPALVEGVAVAATPVQGPLSLHQNAKAMQHLNLLPPVQQLMGLKFLSLYSRSAYTAAGSFCLFIHDTFGAKALKQLYAGATAKKATGHSLAELESQWRRFLDTVAVSERNLQMVKYQYDRPSIVESRCVREVARLQKNAMAQRESFQWQAAVDTLFEAHRVSGYSTDTALSLFFTQAICDRKAAVTAGQKLLNQNPGSHRELQISEALIDMQIGTRPIAELAAKYQAIVDKASSEDDMRRIYAKYHFAGLGTHSAKTVVHYLSTVEDSRRPSSAETVYALKQIETGNPQDPLLAYLCARILFLENDFYGTASEMKRALDQNLAVIVPMFVTRARFTLGQAYLRLRQYSKATQQFDLIKKERASEGGDVARAEDFCQRVLWQKRRQSAL